MTDFLPAGNLPSLQIKQTRRKVALPDKGTEKAHGWQKHILYQQDVTWCFCLLQKEVCVTPHIPLPLFLYSKQKTPKQEKSHRWKLDKREHLDIFKDAKLRKFMLLFKDVTWGSLTAGEQVPWLSQGFRLKMWLTSQQTEKDDPVCSVKLRKSKIPWSTAGKNKAFERQCRGRMPLATMTACETGYFQQAALQKINAEGKKG